MTKRFTLCLLVLATAVTAVQARRIVIKVYGEDEKTPHQKITGFGAADCDGAMKPYGSDIRPVQLLYGKTSKVGLNIMRMEISPSFNGNDGVSWGSTYNWYGSVPCAREAKRRGAIVFGTPWSPPGAYKTNGTAQGGNSDDQGNQRGELREDCYEKFFPWLNSYLAYMKSKGIAVDAVSVQNEPDWWVSYSGCLYTPAQQVTLVKNYAHMLDRETYNGVKLISAEPLGFTQNYSDALMNDPVAREQIDIVAGHIYGHAPLDNGNMKDAAVLALKYGKEIWMTEHSVSDYLEDRLPNWDEQIDFAQEINECMEAGCSGYIYWYMRAHWAFVGTGETKYGTENKKNVLLPRAYIYSHFAKHLAGSTRLQTRTSPADVFSGTNSNFEYNAFVNGDSLIMIAINAIETPNKLVFKFPKEVKVGKQIISTGNDKTERCIETDIELEEPTTDVTVDQPGKSICTFIFKVYHEEDAISNIDADKALLANDRFSNGIYDFSGRRLSVKPIKGLYIQNGKKMMLK